MWYNHYEYPYNLHLPNITRDVSSGWSILAEKLNDENDLTPEARWITSDCKYCITSGTFKNTIKISNNF